MATFRELNWRGRLGWIRGLLYRSRACGKKQRCSRASAWKAKAVMEQKTGREFDVYWCPWCWKHHIGGTVR